MRQHTVCLKTILFKQLLANSQRTRGAKYSLPILITRLCRNFLPDMAFAEYDQVLITTERITSAYNSCLYSIWTPAVQIEDVPAQSSSEEQMEEENDPEFWQQPPLSNSTAFMPSIWKGMKKIFKGQIKLRRQLDEQNTRLERIEETLRRSHSASLSTSAGLSRRRRRYLFFPFFIAFAFT